MNTLMVIDDDPLVLNCFRHVFSEDAVAVRSFKTATEALADFRANRPDAGCCAT